MSQKEKKNLITDITSRKDLGFLQPSKPSLEIPKKRITKSKKICLLIFLAVFILVAGFYLFNLLDFKKIATRSGQLILNEFKKAGGASFNLEFEKTKNSFEAIKEELKMIKSKADQLGLTKLSSTLPKIFNNAGQLTAAALALNENLEYLKNNGFKLMTDKKGEALIEIFEKMKNNLETVSSSNIELKKQAAQLGYLLKDDDFLSLNVNLYKSRQFLESFINWLKYPGKQHFLILFQNPSEIRPSGGFIGSYARLIIDKGSLIDIDVQDIYDPDGQLDSKIIPPKPLQGITPNWGARDANWFFDFPTSARKVIEFLENSKIYSERSVKFSGAIAINTDVIKSLLELTGPIESPERNLTIDNENFLTQIQYEVEAGEDKKAGEPKRILKILMPILFEKISNLNGEQKQILIQKFKNHLELKDIMMFFKEKVMQSYLENLEIAGEIIKLPLNFNGDYLAVVNANIGGGKSDLFIRQNIKLRSQISLDGKIYNNLTIERIHDGDKRDEWWYKTTNRNFFQILVPPNSKLDFISGQDQKIINPLINYQKSGYQIDADLKAIEETIKPLKEFSIQSSKQFGKTAFAGWINTKAGSQKTLQLQYQNPNRFPLANLANYQFIFEKQSGVKGSLEFSIETPPGYRWRENDDSVFAFSAKNPQKREIINLTLVEVLR